MKLFRKKGFALITILLITIILVILLTSIVFLTSHILHRINGGSEKQSINTITDSAVTEVLIKLEQDINWGKNNEILFMTSGGQDLKKAGLDSSAIASSNSNFSFEGKGAYYISFNPEDPAFTDEKCYSVNNLSGSTEVQGWREDEEVPPNTMDIIITAISDEEVKHVEVLIQGKPKDFIQSGSRGEISISTNKLKLHSQGDPFSLHSNYDNTSMEEVSIAIYDLPDSDTFVMQNTGGSTITACDEISHPACDPNSFKSNSSFREIPVLNITNMVQDITFETDEIPSGTYIVDGNNLNYYMENNGPPSAPDRVIPKNKEIVPGLTFKGEQIFMDKNLKVAYSNTLEPGKTGNLTFKGLKNFKVQNSSLYLPGNGTRDFTGAEAPYYSGNLTISESTNKIIQGKGNIYAAGTINLESLDTNPSTDTSGSNKLDLYAEGDINIETSGNTMFRGLIYTLGDFYCNVQNNKRFNLTGAILVAGKDPSTDPDGASFDRGLIDINAGEVDITFDDAYLSPLATAVEGASNEFKVTCWYEY